MASGTLYTFPENFRAFKVLIASQYSGAKVQVASNFELGKTNKSEDFLKKFPTGKVPAFESQDGKYLSESNAIAHFVGNKQLRGATEFDQSLIQHWISYADGEILPAMCIWVFPCLGIIQYNKQTTERAKEDVKKALTILNNHLLTRTYLVGERISQADISVACILLYLYKHVLEPKFREPYGNVNRWFTTLVNQPEFKAILGDIKLCEKMEQFDAKKFAELQGKAGKGQDKKEKGKEEKKQQEKKQPKKKKADDDDEDDKPLVPQEKKKDPFEKIPKGNFDMDDFKRKYSNESKDISIPYFWEKLDKENYSIWYGTYSYSSSLKLLFMTSNLVNGMYQRLDSLRKNAFGCSIISGVNNDNTISSVWVWRGQDLVFKLSPDWGVDYESYEWKKLDINSAETKELVQKYFSLAEVDYLGKNFYEGIVYK